LSDDCPELSDRECRSEIRRVFGETLGLRVFGFYLNGFFDLLQGATVSAGRFCASSWRQLMLTMDVGSLHRYG